MTRAHGFTLLEVLVSISIFAIVGLAANQLLRSVIDTQAHTRESDRIFVETARALQALERDLTQHVSRPVRDGYGDTLPALVLDNDEFLIEFTRTGWNNPVGLPRSEVQRVAYSLENDTLIRHYWLVLDRAQDSEPKRQELLSDVQDVRIVVLDQEGQTHDAWPAFDDETTQSRGVEVSISSEHWGEISRLFSFVSQPSSSRSLDQPDQRNRGGPGSEEETRPRVPEVTDGTR